MLKRFAMAVLPLVWVGLASAQTTPDCKAPVTQADMNICAALDYEAADAELNRVWKQARAAAKAIDDDQSEESWKGADKALLAAQRGWIAYRDGQCELDGFEARGGSLEPMLVSGCKAEMTRARTKELKDFVSGGEDQ